MVCSGRSLSCGHWPDLLPSCLCLNSLSETESVSFLSTEEATAQSLVRAVFVASTGLSLPLIVYSGQYIDTQWAGASSGAPPGRLLFGQADGEVITFPRL